jgi:hypothetical protein
MKYTILINQAGIYDSGLASVTDLVDWALLDYIATWQCNKMATKIGNKVWVNYRHLINQMPLLGLNNKAAVSKRIKKLTDLGLLEKHQDQNDFRLYVEPTEKYHSTCSFRGEPTLTVANAPLTVANAPLTVANAPLTVANAPLTVANAPLTPVNIHTTIKIQPSGYNHQDNNLYVQTPKSLGLDCQEKTQEDVFLLLPLNAKDTYKTITLTDIADYQTIYPAVDVEQETRNMLGWLRSNPAKRKTKAGIDRFINAWLSKAQDSGKQKSQVTATNSAPGLSVDQKTSSQLKDDYFRNRAKFEEEMNNNDY